MGEENRLADLQKRERELQQELNKTKRDKFRAQAASRRAEILQRMTPIELQAEEALNFDFAAIFNTDFGQRVLAYLRDVRPIVADEIEERIKRVTPTGQSATTVAPIGETANAASNPTT